MTVGVRHYRLILLKKLGCPLWYPDLDENLRATYHEHGIPIGDVGIITGAGQFDFNFDVHGHKLVHKDEALIYLQLVGSIPQISFRLYDNEMSIQMISSSASWRITVSGLKDRLTYEGLYYMVCTSIMKFYFLSF